MKAVLFDIYQTLIKGAPIPREERQQAMAKVAEQFGVTTRTILDRAFDKAIADFHGTSPHPYPEVDVRTIWKSILPDLKDPSGFAAAIEDAVHPTSPIPDASEIIHLLHQRRIPLGIVSNAQAYTHALLDKHLGDAARCFAPEMMIFSYEHLRAKPDPYLFELAIRPLTEQGLSVQDILMVGDSPSNDIAPASRLGLRTHLVSGDRLTLPQAARDL